MPEFGKMESMESIVAVDEWARDVAQVAWVQEAR